MRFFQLPYCRSLWIKCLERSPYFTLSPEWQCGANTNANDEFQNKAIVQCTYTYLKNFCSWIFLRYNVFYNLYFFLLFDTFLNRWVYFWKTQNISESMFLYDTAELLWIACYLLKVYFYISENKITYQNYVCTMTHILMS